MENNKSTKVLEGKTIKMTLEGYYNSLPKVVQPKLDFIRRIADKTGCSGTTVRNWIFRGIKPQKKIHYAILSEETGIPEEELFA